MNRKNFELDSNAGQPALVWYLPDNVRPPRGDGWERLLSHSSGGFSCNSLDGWVQRISLSESGTALIGRIADEEFAAACKGESLDFGVGAEHRAAYQAFLDANGLQVGSLHQLQQAVYPLAPTASVMNVLGADLGDHPEGAALLVLGSNCD